MRKGKTNEKLILYPDCGWCGFYIALVNEDIVVVPFGANVFGYIDILENTIRSFAEKHNLNNYSLYVDLAHISGTEDLGVLLLENKDGFDWLAGIELPFEQLPSRVRSEILRIYKEKGDKVKPILESTTEHIAHRRAGELRAERRGSGKSGSK